jgi:hypothetical protein
LYIPIKQLLIIHSRYKFAESGDDHVQKILSDEYREVHDQLATEARRIRLPEVQASTFEEPRLALSNVELNLDLLVELREQHQTRQAALGMRKGKTVPQDISEAEKMKNQFRHGMEQVSREDEEDQKKRKLCEEMQKALKEVQEPVKGVASGLDHPV